MEIIAHRGYWKEKSEQNSFRSFELAIAKGYGIETDLRDLNGNIVISHDPPIQNSKDFLVSFESLLVHYSKQNSSVTLALNIKSDGICLWVKDLLKKYNINNYFIFDCSIPELLRYQKSELLYYSRESDIEPAPNLYERSSGVWLDQFYDLWFSQKDIIKHIAKGKHVCVVSSELHQRRYYDCWQMLKGLKEDLDKVSLCTDYPDEAKEFFYEKN